MIYLLITWLVVGLICHNLFIYLKSDDVFIRHYSFLNIFVVTVLGPVSIYLVVKNNKNTKAILKLSSKIYLKNMKERNFSNHPEVDKIVKTLFLRKDWSNKENKFIK